MIILDEHSYHLDELLNNMCEVDEDMRDISCVIKEPIWLPSRSHERTKMCDIITLYHDGFTHCLELKRSKSKRDKAEEQLDYGGKLSREKFGLPCRRKKFVQYNKKGFNYQVVDYNEL